MKHNHIIILVWGFLLFSSINSIGQTTNDQSQNSVEVSKITRTDSLQSNSIDSTSIDNLDNILSDKLDSMVHTWYVQNAFPVDSLEKALSTDTLQQELPDSLYISRLQNLDSFIPLPYNESVKKFINFYFNRRRGMVSIMMGLTSYYFPLFEEALAKYDLPAELKYLPIIESALNPKIVSRAGASGLWQFMHGTGKMYGLEINSYIDERNDPVKSTDAAARYLKDLFAIYGDWHVVIAAYNCGPGNINKAVRRSGGKQSYWEIYSKLPRETRGYIPIFIAANYVMNYAKEHKLIAVQPSFKVLTDTIVINSYLNFEQIESVLNIPIMEIRQLNPQYKRDIIPARGDKHFVLKLPIDKISPFIDNQTQIFAFNRDKYFPNNQIVSIKDGSRYFDTAGKKKITYVVKAGDNPRSVANKYKITVALLSEWNIIRHNRIKVGQKLTIYMDDKSKVSDLVTQKGKSEDSKRTAAAEVSTKPTESITGAIELNSEFTYYTVRPGDSLYTIAKQFAGVSDVELKILNNIKNTKGLTIGQKLKIPIKA
jgi:membrane-bound lytic murein transglycosylase D